jgi:hypothetical protein
MCWAVTAPTVKENTMPIMSAVTAGVLPNKRRIHKSESSLQYRIGLEFIVDNGSTIDLNDYIDGLTQFPHPGARTFTLGTPVFDSGAPEGTPLTREGDVLTLNEIPFGFSGGVSFGTGSVLITLDLAGTHDFDPIDNVPNFEAPLQLVHDASDSVFNGGSAVMRFDGSVESYICLPGWGGDRCSDLVFEP